jgi:O-antigen/teichoic acid export membrane protein
MFGVWFSVIGAIITIVLNILFIPKYGYMASAWTTLAAYFVMCMVSYLVGRKYYPIPYNLRKIITLILVSIGIAYISMQVPFDNFIVRLTINTALLTAFLLMVYNMDTQVREVVLRYKKKLWK